jgi:hypothetical protein
MTAIAAWMFAWLGRKNRNSAFYPEATSFLSIQKAAAQSLFIVRLRAWQSICVSA